MCFWLMLTLSCGADGHAVRQHCSLRASRQKGRQRVGSQTNSRTSKQFRPNYLHVFLRASKQASGRAHFLPRGHSHTNNIHAHGQSRREESTCSRSRGVANGRRRNCVIKLIVVLVIAWTASRKKLLVEGMPGKLFAFFKKRVHALKKLPTRRREQRRKTEELASGQTASS